MHKKINLPTLLIISDNPSIISWIKNHLDPQFFPIEARSELKALEILRSTPLDFIILDSSMEDIDPLSLCKSLRNASPLTPILLITGRLKKSYLNDALEAGATDFLNAQLDPEELEMRIATVRKAAALREKTHDISSAISFPKEKTSSAYLKNKILFHSQILEFLNGARRPISLLLVQVDHFSKLQSEREYTFIEEFLLKVHQLIQSSLKETDLAIPSSEGRFILLSEEPPRSLAEHLHNKESPLSTLSIVFCSIEPTETALNSAIHLAISKLKNAPAKCLISIDKDLP
ncbi:MAG: response regulator [Verrucomicrobia bacterium]|nr:response regulator [Verrucomicrobiota bacterium]